jgi:replicative DNA helicase
MVRAVAEATQTDPAMAGTSALSALATCAGGHAEIEIRSGWREPLCL